MPSYRADETPERPFASPAASFVLSEMDRKCIRSLVGHPLAHVQRELILQTLRRHQGNRTRAADRREFQFDRYVIEYAITGTRVSPCRIQGKVRNIDCRIGLAAR